MKKYILFFFALFGAIVLQNRLVFISNQTNIMKKYIFIICHAAIIISFVSCAQNTAKIVVNNDLDYGSYFKLDGKDYDVIKQRSSKTYGVKSGNHSYTWFSLEVYPEVSGNVVVMDGDVKVIHLSK